LIARSAKVSGALVKRGDLGASPSLAAFQMPVNAKSRRLAFQASVSECESRRGYQCPQTLSSARPDSQSGVSRCVELRDLEQAAPDAAAQLRLREVLEDELGLEDAPEVPIGAVEPVLGAEAYQSFQGH